MSLVLEGSWGSGGLGGEWSGRSSESFGNSLNVGWVDLDGDGGPDFTEACVVDRRGPGVLYEGLAASRRRQKKFLW